MTTKIFLIKDILQSIFQSKDNESQIKTEIEYQVQENGSKNTSLNPILRYNSIQDFRKNPPAADIKGLDLSSCEGLTYNDLSLLPLGLQTLDISNSSISSDELEKILKILKSLLNLRLLNMNVKFPTLFNPFLIKTLAISLSGCSYINFKVLEELELHDFEETPVVKYRFNLDCPSLQKLHLKFKRELDINKLSGILSYITSVSPLLSEVNLYLLPEDFQKNYENLNSTFPAIMPKIAFYLHHNEVKKTELVEVRKIIYSIVNQATRVREGTVKFDFLKALETDLGYFDTEIYVKNNEIIKAHKVILQYRCPNLLCFNNRNKVLLFDKCDVERFLKYLYADILALNSDGFIGENELINLNCLARYFGNERLSSLCCILLQNSFSSQSEIPTIPESTFMNDILQSSQDPKFWDVYLNGNDVIYENEDKIETIPSSKFILASRCSYFHGFFRSGMMDSLRNHITLSQHSIRAIASLVTFFVTDTCSFDIHIVSELWRLAHYLSLPRLQALCEQNTKSSINPENAVRLCIQSHMEEAEPIREISFKFTLENALVIYKREELIYLDWNHMELLLSCIYNYLLEIEHDDVNTPELQFNILSTILNWTKYHCFSGENVNLEHLRSTLNNIFQYIHASRISLVDFARCLAMTGIFPEPLVQKVFFGMGILLDEDMGTSVYDPIRLNSENPQCAECNDQGYTIIYQNCYCLQSSNTMYCHLCNFSGQTKSVGPPCKFCISGEIVRLKNLFDDKFAFEMFPLSTLKHLQQGRNSKQINSN